MAEKRLIDAEALTAIFSERRENASSLRDRVYLDGVLAIIDSAPTIDAVEVRHAKWVNTSSPDEDNNVDCNCSNCGAGDKHAKGFHVPFCWKCGASMNAEKESEGK